MADRNCFQVNIPSVNNANKACGEVHSSKCIKVEYPATYFQDIVDPSLYDFFVQFETILKELKKADTAQKGEIDNLKSTLRQQQTDINNLKQKVDNLLLKTINLP